MRTVAALAIVLAGFCAAAHGLADVPSLRAGDSRLAFVRGDGGRFGIALSVSGTPAARQAMPAAIEVVGADGAATWLAAGYDEALPKGDTVECRSTLRTTRGSAFEVRDTYRALPKQAAFTVARRVTVAQSADGDAAFSSRFAVEPLGQGADADYLMPGVLYQRNQHVPPTALASHLDDRAILVREDRLALPLVMQRARGGLTVTMAHLNANGGTIARDDGLARLADDRLQYGSLGILNEGPPSLAFQFPGTEGERTYVYGGSREGGRWALRSHPIRTGVAHSYTLLLKAGRTPDYPSAVQDAWRTVYALYAPAAPKCNLAAVYRESLRVLAAYLRRYDGAISMPFTVTVPEGVAKDTSSQMGFVGEALPAAALLLRDPKAAANSGITERAAELVDFWARECLTPSGLPRTWYDVRPGGKVTWRGYPTYLRVACDGMLGALEAWQAAKRAGSDHPEWLAFCRRYGDWLVANQAADGSLPRAVAADGRVAEPDKGSTVQAIPFLAALYRATGSEAYRRAALKAGEFARSTVDQAYTYIGGTPDNPNVTDKEAGLTALAAFLALADIDEKGRWIGPATRAAEFAETWLYAWNVPMPAGDPAVIFPPGRSTVGLSLIATGHSGADTFMSGAAYDYYRLYLLGGDRHFLDVARLLLHGTKQLLDLDGSLGYAHRGLQTEALTLAPLRGHGVKAWLPWLTVKHLEPLARFQGVFGTTELDAIERLPLAERQRRVRQASDRRKP